MWFHKFRRSSGGSGNGSDVEALVGLVPTNDSGSSGIVSGSGSFHVSYLVVQFVDQPVNQFCFELVKYSLDL